MSIYSIDKFIRNIRIRKGYTQEQFCEGICKPATLSRIETGKNNVSLELFQKFMNRAGVNVSMLPSFHCREEFDVFHNLKQALFYIDYWDLDSAYFLICESEQLINKCSLFFYQLLQLSKSRLLMRSCKCNYNKVYHYLTNALFPSIDMSRYTNLNGYILSLYELQLLIEYVHCKIQLGDYSYSLKLAMDIDDYFKNSTFSSKELALLKTNNLLALCKCNFYLGNYNKALSFAKKGRIIAVNSIVHVHLHELTLWESICREVSNEHDAAHSLFYTCYISAYSLKLPFIVMAKELGSKYLTSLDFSFISSFPELKFNAYTFSDNICYTNIKSTSNIDKSNVYKYSFGDIIADIRKEQHISQLALCKGLCSQSMLSKIENNNICINPYLAYALLSRLGIKHDIFPFYNTAINNRIDVIRENILLSKIHNNKNDLVLYLNQLYQLIDNTDLINLQYYFLSLAITKDNPNERLNLLFKAFSLTMDASTKYFKNLSFQELTILNNIAYTYGITGMNIKALQILYNLQSYYDNMTAYENHTSYSITCNLITQLLYQMNQFNEIESLDIEDSFSRRTYSYNTTANLYFYLYLSRIKMHAPKEKIIKAYLFACSNYKLIGDYTTPQKLRTFLQQDLDLII